MSGQATRVAHVAPHTHATRNFDTDKRNNDRNTDATVSGHLPMTASELRTQLRAQQQRNRGVAIESTQAVKVALVVAPAANVEFAQLAAQQENVDNSTSPYETQRVARCAHRVLPNATTGKAAADSARAVLDYDLIDGKGGLLIDPAGPSSAVHELHWRFGSRIDWPALLATFQAREHEADHEAADLIRRIMADE